LRFPSETAAKSVSGAISRRFCDLAAEIVRKFSAEDLIDDVNEFFIVDRHSQIRVRAERSRLMLDALLIGPLRSREDYRRASEARSLFEDFVHADAVGVVPYEKGNARRVELENKLALLQIGTNDRRDTKAAERSEKRRIV